jgi:hypothetical protein
MVISNSTNAPDCANCDRPLRAICALLARKFTENGERSKSGLVRTGSGESPIWKFLSGFKAQLWRGCAQPQCPGRARSREARMRLLN